MYIKILLYYILGYLRVEIEGFFIERFINICISKGIFLWNIKRDKSTIVYLNIGIKDFKKIVRIAKEIKCKIKIKSKKGLPFIFNRYRKRKVFFILFVVVIGVIIGLSNFVWNVEITGNVKISKEELLDNLKDKGLKEGTYKHSINLKEIINELRLKRNDLAWIGIEIKGTNAVVKVVESEEKPEIIDENDFCNIVAKKAGQIVKVNALNRYFLS